MTEAPAISPFAPTASTAALPSASVSAVEALADLPSRTASDQQRLREAAGTVVGQVFFGPLLAQVRDSRLRGDLGHGGRGEDAFLPQLHAKLIDEVSSSKQLDLADVLVDRFADQQRRLSTAAGAGLSEWTG